MEWKPRWFFKHDKNILRTINSLKINTRTEIFLGHVILKNANRSINNGGDYVIQILLYVTFVTGLSIPSHITDAVIFLIVTIADAVFTWIRFTRIWVWNKTRKCESYKLNLIQNDFHIFMIFTHNNLVDGRTTLLFPDKSISGLRSVSWI